MKIGILARGLGEIVGGVKQYIYELTRALLNINSSDEFIIFYNTNELQGTFDSYPNVKEVIINCRNKFLWDHFLIPRYLKRKPVDILFCPKNVIPLAVECPALVTVHDMMYFPQPKEYPSNEYKFLDRLYMRHFIPSSLKKAIKIISDSENTKVDIIRILGIPEGKIEVIHLGVGQDFRRMELKNEKWRLLLERRVRQPYIFYSGTISRRKNIVTVLRSLKYLEHKIPHQLVITGGGPEKEVPLEKLVKSLGLEDRVLRLGVVDFESLLHLYSGADLFVYPSLYEGFGLPVLEAMACGCPVICSNTSSIPEAAGDAALKFNPRDSLELATKIRTLVSDSSVRAGLIEKGYRRAQESTWEKAARKLSKIIDSAVKLKV